ncbi:MAG TPA: hypothetical protein VG248_11095 [Caulobacteraceae bacterium]|jgi:hypothetical protein|nr:hypothetical protein [Caulobacteraceae bacterium]
MSNPQPSTAATSPLLDNWLADMRRRLAGLSAAESQEVIAELRSHVLDRAAGGDEASIRAALAGLGEPADLARLNLAARLTARSGAAPWRILSRIGVMARVSVGGFWALIVSVVGYSLAAAWLLVAALKPVLPKEVGLWRGPGSFVLGVADHHGPGAELMGWWVIPVGLALGLLLAFGTWRHGRWSLRRLARAAAPVTA